MTMTMFFDYSLIAYAILIPMGVLKYMIREIYARQLQDQSEAYRLRVFKSTAFLLKWTKLFLYLSPLMLIILPYNYYKYEQVDLLTTITFTVLLIVTVALEYLFRKWLNNHLVAAKLQS
jgi:hypothetical protein